jgi:hypothetical protein
MLTQVEYARHIGKTKQYVNKLAKSGRIPVGADGKIDPEAADEAMRRAADPARRLRAPIAAEPQDDDQGEASPQTPKADSGGVSFTHARTAREAYMAKLAKLEYERQMDAFRPKAEVVEGMVAAGRRIRQGLDAIPTWAEEITALITAGSDSFTLRSWLRTKVRALEQMIADHLTADARDDDAQDDA